MKTSDFDYDLPPELIAQEPLPNRSGSRMLVVHRATQALEHSVVSRLPRYLRPNDVLVVNDTRVIPARIFGRRTDTGGRVELLLVEEKDGAPVRAAGERQRGPCETVWEAFYRASGRARPGLDLSLAGDRLQGKVVDVGKEGKVLVRLRSQIPLSDVLAEEGFAPVPPYVKREAQRNDLTVMDRERYQTVYARREGSVAAPTAGLHFTDELLDELAQIGVRRAAITLHVGPGTFKPVKSDYVGDHDMESERYSISGEVVAAIQQARLAGGRVVAVGSTSVRALETMATPKGGVSAGEGRTSLFITPPHDFRVVDVMLTNFHLPRSTLIMMVCALAGGELILRAYREAIRLRYRFYSYGDCMLIV